ncbi:MAG: CoA transferase [Chloroflexi bacterium]|nr:CoA transferase [Chloroflexota bacterium]
MNAAAPLADLRVLDLSHGGGAAACVRLLALLGAEVLSPELKVLSPESAFRTPQPGVSTLVVADRETADLLASGATVVVSVTPWGLNGAPADRPAAGSLLDGLGPGVAAALAGAHAAAAALAALRWARCHHRRVVVEVSTLEVVAACLGEYPLPALCPRWTLRQAGRERVDRRLVILPCADGYVGVAAPTAVDRAYLATLVGLEAVRDEAADLGKLLGPWLQARTREEVFHAAQLWRLPFVPVLEPAEVLRDEQSAARNVWEHDALGKVVPRSPFRFTPAAGAAPRAARPRPLPLSDVRVLDLGMVWAGPYCGRLLAGLGARVVKVEGPTRPDGTRPSGRSGCWGVFGDLNRGKASLVLDLSRPAGRELFLRLVARADMVVENFSPRVMPNFGLHYAALAAANPSLIMLSMPAFGASGPWASYVAYGSGLELATGLALRQADGRPAPAPVPYLDYLVGCYGTVGLLAALHARDRSGRGVHLEVAQREVACQVLAQSRVSSPGSRVQGLEPEGGSRVPRPALDAAAIAADPCLVDRGLFAVPARAGQPCHHYARLPWRLHGIPERRERAAPALGAASRRILCRDLGLDPGEVEGLIKSGVVGAIL